MQKARDAQKVIEYWPQEKVDTMVAAVGWALYKEENAVKCAELAARETKMGVYEDKLVKHRKKTLGTLRDLQGVRTVGIVEVNEEKGLFKVATYLGLGDYILLGKGEEQTHGREKASILANTMEALLGALYLDAGFARTKEIIDKLFLPLINSIDTNRRSGDFKSLLQEYTQEIDKTRPEYLLMDENGPAHDRTFKVAIRLNGEVVSEGLGKSKKEAEQKAAKEAYLCLSGERKDL